MSMVSYLSKKSTLVLAVFVLLVEGMALVSSSEAISFSDSVAASKPASATKRSGPDAVPGGFAASVASSEPSRANKRSSDAQFDTAEATIFAASIASAASSKVNKRDQAGSIGVARINSFAASIASSEAKGVNKRRVKPDKPINSTAPKKPGSVNRPKRDQAGSTGVDKVNSFAANIASSQPSRVNKRDESGASDAAAASSFAASVASSEPRRASLNKRAPLRKIKVENAPNVASLALSEKSMNG